MSAILNMVPLSNKATLLEGLKVATNKLLVRRIFVLRGCEKCLWLMFILLQQGFPQNCLVEEVSDQDPGALSGGWPKQRQCQMYNK